MASLIADVGAARPVRTYRARPRGTLRRCANRCDFRERHCACPLVGAGRPDHRQCSGLVIVPELQSVKPLSTLAIASVNTCAPSTMSSSAVFSLQWWLMPPIDGTNIIAAGSLRASILRVMAGAARHAQVCGPAHGARRRRRAPPSASRPCAPACLRRPREFERAAAVAVGVGNELIERRLHALEHGGIGIAELEHRFGAAGDDARAAGIERDAPGGPHAARAGDLREALVDGASRRTSARPASRRRAIEVVPAWFCSPVTVMRYCQIATIAVTTPIFRPPASSVSPCSICASKKPA